MIEKKLFCIVCGSPEAIIDVAVIPSRTACRNCGVYFRRIIRDFDTGSFGFDKASEAIVLSGYLRADVTAAVRSASDRDRSVTFQHAAENLSSVMGAYRRDRFWQALKDSIRGNIGDLDVGKDEIQHSLDEPGSPDFFSVSRSFLAETFNLKCQYLRDECEICVETTAMSRKPPFPDRLVGRHAYAFEGNALLMDGQVRSAKQTAELILIPIVSG